MLKFLVTAGLLIGAIGASGAMERDVEIEIRRLEQSIAKSQDTSMRAVKDLRGVQRKVDDLTKTMEGFEKKIDEMTDILVKLRNVEISNLKAGQKSLYDQIPIMNWGHMERDCDSIKTKHQQVQSVKAKDGSKTVTYICFDGKPIHIRTELNEAP